MRAIYNGVTIADSDDTIVVEARGMGIPGDLIHTGAWRNRLRAARV